MGVIFTSVTIGLTGFGLSQTQVVDNGGTVAIQGHLIFPNNTTSIDFTTAYQNKSLKEVTLPSNISSVPKGTFINNQELKIVRLSRRLYDSIAFGEGYLQKRAYLRLIFGPQVERYEDNTYPEVSFIDHLIKENGNEQANDSGVLTINDNPSAEVIQGESYQGLEYEGQKFTELKIEGAIQEIVDGSFANNHDLVAVRLKRKLYDLIVREGSPVEKSRRLEAIFGTQVETYSNSDGSILYTDHIEQLNPTNSNSNNIKFDENGKINENIFIYVTGQSNGAGEDYRDNPKGEYNIESTNVEILNPQGNSFVPLKKKNGLTLSLWLRTLQRHSYSTAAKFADNVGKVVEGDVKVANFSIPAAGFRYDGNAFLLAPSFQGNSVWFPSNLINLITTENVVKQYQKNYRPVFFWHQGESDVVANTTTAQYFDFMSTMISTYRDLVQDQSAPFILGGYKDTWVGMTRAQVNVIETANKLLADTIPNVGYASARGIVGNVPYPLYTDYVHFAAQGMEEFAARYFKEFQKNVNDLTPPNFSPVQKGEYKIYSETRSNSYLSSTGNNWIKILRSGDDKTESFSKLADIWKYRNKDGYKFKYVAYSGNDSLTVTFKQNLNPTGILHSEREKLKDLLKFELLNVEDTSGQLNINNISFDAMTIWDTNGNSALNASKQGFFNGLGHNFALASRGNKIVSSKEKTSSTFNVADKIEFYAIKD